MNLTGKVASLVYALVLLGCAGFAGFDTFAFAFAIGDADGRITVASGTFLIGTLAGGGGLAIASLGSWTQWRPVRLVALASALVVLPAAVLYGWQSANAFWNNTQLGMHYGPWAWASAILPPFLGLAGVVWSWERLRQLSALSQNAPPTR